jgi:hypothetical protein
LSSGESCKDAFFPWISSHNQRDALSDQEESQHATDDDVGAAHWLQTRAACGFPILNAEVIVVALTMKKSKPESFPPPPATSAPTASPAAPPLPAEQTPPAYPGDVIVFLLWMGCFLLVASMIIYETIVGVFFRR